MIKDRVDRSLIRRNRSMASQMEKRRRGMLRVKNGQEEEGNKLDGKCGEDSGDDDQQGDRLD